MKKILLVWLWSSLLLSACSPTKSTDELISESKQSIESQEYSQALIQLKNLIKSSPKLAEARYLLANVYIRFGQLENAEKELKKAIEFGFSDPLAQIKLAEVHLELLEDKEAISVLESKQFADKELSAAAAVIKAKALLNLKREDEAKIAFQKALTISPNAAYSLYGQAILSVINGDLGAAKEFIEQVVDKSPNLADARLLKAKIHEENNDFVEAEQEYTSYLQLRPRAHNVKLLLANSFIKQKKLSAAEGIVDELFQLNSEHPTVNLMKAQLASVKKDYATVKLHAEVVLNYQPEQPLALYLSGVSNYLLGNYEQANVSLSAVTPYVTKTDPAHKMLLLTMLKLGYTEKISEYIKSSAIEDDELLNQIASRFVVQGNTQDAEDIFKRVATMSPDNVDARKRLAVLRVMNEDLQGVADLEKINENGQDKNVVFILAAAYVNEKNYDKAIEVIKAYTVENPEDIEALILQAKVLLLSGEDEQGHDVINTVLSIDSEQPNALFILARSYVISEDYERASDALKKAINSDTSYKDAYSLLQLIAKKQGSNDKFVKYLETIAASNVDAIWPRIFLAQQKLSHGKVEQALEQLPVFEKNSKRPSAYYATLMDIYYEKNEMKRIADIADYWIEIDKKNVVPYLKYIELFEKRNMLDQARTVASQGISNVGSELDKLRLLVLEVSYLLKLQDYSGVDGKLKQLVNKLPNNNIVRELAGEYALHNRDVDGAILHLEKAFEISPRSRTVFLLINAYRQSNKVDTVFTFLERVPSEIKETPAIKTLIAELYIKSDVSKSVSIYRELSTQLPDNIMILNNLAWLLSEKGQHDEGIDFARKALKLAPDNPQILDTLGVALLNSGNIKEATTVLEKSYSASKDPETLMHYVSSLVKNDEKQKATELINSLDMKIKEKFKNRIDQILKDS